ncbi:hypothetical protein [Streptomyces sp. NPDC058394]|uniref:hypothetical protein n=1 Tax=Streptomyces sp. NPDC058394 TaxID=3346477 RepID=UPI00366088B7
MMLTHDEQAQVMRDYIKHYKEVNPISSSDYSRSRGYDRGYITYQKANKTKAWQLLSGREQLEINIMTDRSKLPPAEVIAAEVQQIEQRMRNIQMQIDVHSAPVPASLYAANLRPVLMPYGSPAARAAAVQAAATDREAAAARRAVMALPALPGQPGQPGQAGQQAQQSVAGVAGGYPAPGYYAQQQAPQSSSSLANRSGDMGRSVSGNPQRSQGR